MVVGERGDRETKSIETVSYYSFYLVYHHRFASLDRIFLCILLQALEDLGDEPQEDERQLVEAKAAAGTAIRQLQTYDTFGLFRRIYESRIPPSTEATSVLKAVFYTLGYDKLSLGDSTALDKRAFFWPRARQYLAADFLEQLAAFDPTSVPSDADKGDQPPQRPYHAADAIKSMIDGLDKDELTTSTSSPIYSTFIDWIVAILSAREAFTAKQKREKEEEEARRQAEAEAAEADGEGGDGEDDGGEDEEDDDA